MKYDIELRQAAAEFRELCKKYDIGGHAIFTSKTHCEFIAELTPSWSQLEWKGEGSVVFKNRGSTPEGKVRSEATAHMLFSIRDQVGNAFLMFDELCKFLEAKIGVVHQSQIGRKPESTPEDPL